MKQFILLNPRILLLLALLQAASVSAQKNLPIVDILTQGTPTSIRGLSVVNENVVWASGSRGIIGKSTNGGKDWKWVVVKGFEKTDFRDIEAFDATSAIIMGTGEPAYILKTIDGGETWKVVYENKSKGMFLDAMEFWNEQSGIVIGDPIDGKFFVARTFDGGNTWEDLPEERRPQAENGEALFAASGTNVRVLDRDEAVFVTGGQKSRLFIRDEAIPIPIMQGKETTGANSVSVFDDYKRKGGKRIIVVGGDFSSDTTGQNNCYFTTNRGKTWKEAKIPPRGYRSCVEFLTKTQVITAGMKGVDYSWDGGNTWKPISDVGFHVVKMAKEGRGVYLAGSNGRIARVRYPDETH
jgi:photosystem II stability/assembly factor-like uncharacterized protein